MLDKLARLCLRQLIAREPCIICSFALATHGKNDVAFGLGPPKLCFDHAKQAIKDDQEDWRPVPNDYYCSLTRHALGLLGLDLKKRSTKAWTTTSRITLPKADE